MQLLTLALFSLVTSALASPAPVKRAPLSYTPAGAQKGNWKTLGCYNDLYPNGRALTSGYQDNAAGGTTIGNCLAYCASQGTYLAGIENGNQCFCGQALTSGSSATQAAPLTDARNGGCSTPCQGNSTQSCGGPNRLLLFQSTVQGQPKRIDVAGQTYRGCFQDNTNNRLLPYFYQGDPNPSMTPALCTSGCNSRGYDLSGLEYRYQCLCGNSQRTTLPAALPDASCDTSCSGDANALCGGASKLTIYQSNTQAPPPSNPTTVPRVTTTDGKVYNYQGCYTDRSTASGRALTGQSRSDPANTINNCVAYCSAAGFAIAGAEYGTECYCGRTLQAFSKATATCNTGCGGNSTQLCGGGYALSLYRLA